MLIRNIYVEPFLCCPLFMLYYFHATFFVLHSLHVGLCFFLHIFFHIALFSCCSFFVLPLLHTALFSCSIFSHCFSFVFHCFHVAHFLFLITLYSYCTFSMLHFNHIALFSCCFVCIALFHAGRLSCCTFSVLHSFLIAVFLCCTLFRMHSFMLHNFHVALFSNCNLPCCIIFLLYF